MSAHQLVRRRQLLECRFGLKSLLVAVAMAAIYLPAYIAIFRHATRQEAFMMTAVPVAVACASFLGTRLAAKRHAGKVLLRLPGKPARVPSLLASVILPLAVVLLAKAIDLSPNIRPILSIVLVALMTLSAWSTLVAVLERRLELCDFGILVNGTTFSPWHQIGPSGWNLDDEGRLFLGLGLWKIEGQVPPYKRHRVKELLKKKTAEPA
jgi:hypothetical protein